ncbi:MAG TPA: N-acetyltransferase [Candidatus Eisenbacteria bacterium]|jgi:ribosomal protein S18 acetylase RimI-like enzyme
MGAAAEQVRIRAMDELDLSRITAIDERLTGVYRPEIWERRVAYYLRRDPDASRVAEVNGKVVGFMLADLRGGEFGLEEVSGWIERFGVDPDYQGRSVGRRLFDAVADHLCGRGAAAVRTLVSDEDKELARFLRAVGFVDAPMTALEKRLTTGPGPGGAGT